MTNRPEYIPRNVDETLLAWSESAHRKPLVLRGARQTGKSSSVRRLGERFELFLELNLERFGDLELVRSCQSAEDLLLALRTRHDLVRFPKRTLIFLDEIQESPEAVAWLRFLHEDHPELHVVAAGSLMEVRLQERGFSFPVGRVTFRVLRPFTFFEFLRACGQRVLAEQLREAFLAGEPAAPILHQQALDHFRDYLRVGGMPEAVRHWQAHHDPVGVARIHADLLQALAEDLQKYRGVRDVAHLEAAFSHLRHHYGLRFRYENFAPGYRSALMKSALEKLESAMIIHRAWPTSSLRLPLRTRPRSAPKLLPLDVGLALYGMGGGLEGLWAERRDEFVDGREAEMVAGQQLLAAQEDFPGELYFWVSESSRSNAEVDFVLPGPRGPVPVEVKSGASGSLKSLHQFLHRAGLDLAFRLHLGPYSDERHQVKMSDGELRYRLISVPLYLAELVPPWLRTVPQPS